MRAAAALSALLAVGFARPALADKPTKKQCVAAYVDAQRLRKADKLSEALTRLEICASNSCPKTLRRDCGPWLGEVKKNQPTLALSAVGLDGKLTRAVRVILDGHEVASEIPSEPLPVDPGPHQLRFELEGAEPIELKIDVARGEKAKSASADFSKQAPPPVTAPPPPPPVEKEPARPIPVPVYVLGGVGVVGIASFVYFGSKGKSEENDLADTCAPNCNPDDVDASHRKLLIADISLGVGLVALGAATYFYVKRPEKGATETSIGFAPSTRGGSAFVRGTF